MRYNILLDNKMSPFPRKDGKHLMINNRLRLLQLSFQSTI